MKLFSPFSKSFYLIVVVMVLQGSGNLNPDTPECSPREGDPACLGSLVAIPPPSSEGGCDGLGSCRLHVLMPEELATPEEVQDVPPGQQQQMEFKQLLKHTGEINKQNPSRTRTLMDRLSLVENRVLSMSSSLQRLQEEGRVNLNRLEEQLNSLTALLLGILSGCKLPCSDSVLKTSILVNEKKESLTALSATISWKQLRSEVAYTAHCGPRMNSWQYLVQHNDIIHHSPVSMSLLISKESVEGNQDLGKDHKAEETPALLVEPSEKSEHTYPRDCADIHKQGIQDSGIYTIQPIPLRQPFEAYCDMVTDGGGWTVIQRRQDGAVDFNRTWQEYRQGFGSLQGEHWLGNEHLHSLTRLGQHILRIELEDWHGVKRHAIYRKFKVASEANKYRLTAREYQGSAGNALSYSRNYNHDHKCFTTWDSDNDNYPMGNCGTYYGAGWWFDSCLAANLNGKYHRGRYSGVTSGIYWGTWYILIDKRTNQKYSFKKVEMKTRPLSF
ncbi:UNVERIFIED_CONTAM: hypothetical protein K2H54_050743 [Gekko kuhli]